MPTLTNIDLLQQVVSHLTNASNSLSSITPHDNMRVNKQLALLDGDIDRALGRAYNLLAEDRDDT